MSRPRLNEAGYEKANLAWKKTMEEKYGGKEGVHAFMQKIGAMGGKKCCVKGFGANPELAKIAGTIGGFKSRRGISQAYINRVKEAQKMHDEGATNREIAEHFSVSLGTVHNYLVRKV